MGLLRKWFGPSREEIWRKLAAEYGATYVEGGFMERGKVEVTHGEWTITLDSYVVSTGKSHARFTRMRAPYVNPEGFRFDIHRRGVFTDIAKWFGATDIEVGYPEFDHDFVIQGTDEARVKRLFQNDRIRALIAAQPRIELSVRDDEGWFGRRFPEQTDELYFRVLGDIKEVERLKQLFDLFSETLDELCRMGAAYDDEPGVKI